MQSISDPHCTNELQSSCIYLFVISEGYFVAKYYGLVSLFTKYFIWKTGGSGVMKESLIWLEVPYHWRLSFCQAHLHFFRLRGYRNFSVWMYKSSPQNTFWPLVFPCLSLSFSGNMSAWEAQITFLFTELTISFVVIPIFSSYSSRHAIAHGVIVVLHTHRYHCPYLFFLLLFLLPRLLLLHDFFL